MVSIYICDDDKIFRQKLYDNLKAKCEKIGIDYTLSLISTFEELKENSSKIDILFLDVLLGDINTINQIIKDDVSVTFELVILTAFPGEIYNISKISPTYYLDKLRSDEKNLSNALNKCIQNLENRRKQKIIIEHEKISETIDLNDVTYIEAQNKASDFKAKYLYFYIFPVTNILPLIICASTKAFWEESNGDLLYQNIIICITFIVVAIIDFATIFVVDSIRKTDDKNEELLILSTKNEIEYQSLELIKAEREGLRHIKHDIKNIHLTVKELILSGNNEQALDILNQSNDELTEVDGLRLCGNDIINTVFYIKSKEAKAENIELNVEVDIQNNVKIKNIDLARILLNLCDNAINATKECDKKEIYFSITASDKIIKIDTKNPFINRKKVIQEGHGNGTKIIKEIAEKHGGDYKASSENGIYTTHTTLRNIEANI